MRDGPKMEYAELIERHSPWQDPWELNELLLLLNRHGPFDAVLEIGTHRGNSARVWRDALKPELVVSVDKSREVLDESDLDGIEVLTGLPSQHKETVRLVELALHGHSLDFLFIDGGHSYPEVCADWELYPRLLEHHGFVALHDINAGHSSGSKGCHVRLLWDEIRDGNQTVAWAAPGGQGTGLVYLR